nr:trimethylamine methyltransferase family protein [Candidatus Calescibacterium sp.]
MAAETVRPKIALLDTEKVIRIHETSCAILAQIGVIIPDEDIVALLCDHGATKRDGRILIPSFLVEACVQRAGKSFTLYGSDGKRSVTFARGTMVFCSSPGQFAWFEKGVRREPYEDDFFRAVHLAHHLLNIDVVGGLAMPSEYPPALREVLMARELFVRTDKPVFLWFGRRENFRRVFVMSAICAGGEKEAQSKPRLFAFLEPISPLRFPREGLAILKEATSLSLPVMIGPMVQAGSTGPVTLAGTLAQENAEILAGIVIAELLRPGTPICYGGIPHIADPRTGSIVFGSPEQGLLSLAMAEIGAFYGFPVYVNVGLTDSCAFDPQNGWEKGVTLLLGMLSSASTFGHMGIVGSDQGGSLEQLLFDDELIGFCKRIVEGLRIDEEALDLSVVEEGVCEGSFLSLLHTARLIRREFWVPSLSFRGPFRPGKDILERVQERLQEILAYPQPSFEEKKRKELDAFLKEEVNGGDSVE